MSKPTDLPKYYTGFGDITYDVAMLMKASGQHLNKKDSVELYEALIEEEYYELIVAIDDKNEPEIFDACLDLIWVITGLMLAKNYPIDEGWKEVRRSNLEKIGEDGKVTVNADGKVMKPKDWRPPALKELLESKARFLPYE